MAIALSNRRVVLARIEGTRGTAETLDPTLDGVPLLREAQAEIEPVRVDRPTIRLSLTDYADTYPGKYRATLTISVEIHGRDTGFPTTPPSWTRLLRASNFSLFDNAANLFAYRVSALTTDNGPLRHGESVAGTALNVGGGHFMFGDSFSHDGGEFTTVFVNENGAGVGSGTITSVRGGGTETVFTIDQRSTVKLLGYTPDSDVNATGNNATIEVFKDGKKVKAKGCMGNVEFQFNHGDACVAQFTMQGILQAGFGYVDAAIPANAYEGHKLPPTFLGSRVTLSGTANNPVASNRYGSGAAGAIEGALSQIRLNSGNNVLLQDNSLDPDGTTFAIVTDREPTGSINPSEVFNAEYNFMQQFINGTPVRMKILLGATSHNDVTTADLNSFDFMCPGITFTGLADADRDGVNIFDGSFAMGGGDYDTSALGELPGQDNEFVIVHR